MRKLLMIILAAFIGVVGASSSGEHKEEAVIIGLVQSDDLINYKDIQVVDGYLPVHGVTKHNIDIFPENPILKTKTVLSTKDAARSAY